MVLVEVEFMIHFIVGKPGGGKSYYAVLQICHELLHGSRCVVTNLPLRLDESGGPQGLMLLERPMSD